MDVQAEPRERKLHYSRFLVTVNTNYRPVDMADAREVGDKLLAAFRTMLTEEGFRKIIRIIARNGDFSDIVKIQVPDWAVELGKDPRGQRVHLHAYIKIEHYTIIQLSPKEIKDWIKSRIEDDRVKCLKIDIQFVKANEELVKRYIGKHQHPHEKPKEEDIALSHADSSE